MDDAKELLRPAYPAATEASLARLAATYDRIGRQVGATRDLEREKAEALAWCRANGNPHRPNPGGYQ